MKPNDYRNRRTIPFSMSEYRCAPVFGSARRLRGLAAWLRRLGMAASSKFLPKLGKTKPTYSSRGRTRGQDTPGRISTETCKNKANSHESRALGTMSVLSNWTLKMYSQTELLNWTLKLYSQTVLPNCTKVSVLYKSLSNVQKSWKTF